MDRKSKYESLMSSGSCCVTGILNKMIFISIYMRKNKPQVGKLPLLIFCFVHLNGILVFTIQRLNQAKSDDYHQEMSCRYKGIVLRKEYKIEKYI